jgi:hypothetical protein
MQFDFFKVISYIMPFTYAIHAQGAIIFGIGSGADIAFYSLYVLKMVGILCIYLAVFLSLGMIMSKRRQRELLYGTASAKKLFNVFKDLGINNNYVNNATKKVI